MSDLKSGKKPGNDMDEMSSYQGEKRRKVTFRQIIAWIAIILLVGMYVVTLVCSIIDSPLAEQMFHASLYCTFFVPVISWVFLMTVKLVKGSGKNDLYEEDKTEKNKPEKQEKNQ